jgi:ribosomal protein S18 acetylase RimI-like enzyme
MIREAITFRERTAPREDIRAHLERCDGEFLPRLSLKVEIVGYSGKIAAQAETFEAWSGGRLVGLVAAYLNDSGTRVGFITNVSVERDFMGQGVASALLGRCLDRASAAGMCKLALEVGMDSRSAIRLYGKFGFQEVIRTGAIVVMERAIGKDRAS